MSGKKWREVHLKHVFWILWFHHSMPFTAPPHWDGIYFLLNSTCFYQFTHHQLSDNDFHTSAGFYSCSLQSRTSKCQINFGYLNMHLNCTYSTPKDLKKRCLILIWPGSRLHISSRLLSYSPPNITINFPTHVEDVIKILAWFWIITRNGFATWHSPYSSNKLTASMLYPFQN